MEGAGRELHAWGRAAWLSIRYDIKAHYIVYIAISRRTLVEMAVGAMGERDCLAVGCWLAHSLLQLRRRFVGGREVLDH